MELSELLNAFLQGLKNTTVLEYIAVMAGIASVWFSKKENILVYPVGLVNTIIYIYLSFKYHLVGEATVNLYYTIMSIYGWWLWAKKDAQDHHLVHITFSDRKFVYLQLLFFATFFFGFYLALTYLKNNFYEGVIPLGDAFATASAFTGMWLMAKKKVESWLWWIATNIASIPLYFIKGLVFTSVYYIVLLGLAVAGLIEWRNKAAKSATFKSTV